MADDLNIFWLESLLYFPEQIYKVYKENLSIRVPFVLVNLVGSVIRGYSVFLQCEEKRNIWLQVPSTKFKLENTPSVF